MNSAPVVPGLLTMIGIEDLHAHLLSCCVVSAFRRTVIESSGGP